MSEKYFSRGNGVPPLKILRRDAGATAADTTNAAGIRLTPFQRICARSWHNALGVYGTEQLYVLYLTLNKKLIAAQAEIEILRQKLAEAGVPLD